jgi:hypothetical protein
MVMALMKVSVKIPSQLRKIIGGGFFKGYASKQVLAALEAYGENGSVDWIC